MKIRLVLSVPGGIRHGELNQGRPHYKSRYTCPHGNSSVSNICKIGMDDDEIRIIVSFQRYGDVEGSEKKDLKSSISLSVGKVGYF